VKRNVEQKMNENQASLLMEKQKQCRKLRMLFSPPEMLDTNGDIQESYFRPDPSRIFNLDSLQRLTWNKTDEELLEKGIKEFGNDWTAIILKYLPNWDATELKERSEQLNLLDITSEELGKKAQTKYSNLTNSTGSSKEESGTKTKRTRKTSTTEAKPKKNPAKKKQAKKSTEEHHGR